MAVKPVGAAMLAPVAALVTLGATMLAAAVTGTTVGAAKSTSSFGVGAQYVGMVITPFDNYHSLACFLYYVTRRDTPSPTAALISAIKSLIPPAPKLDPVRLMLMLRLGPD